MKKGPDLIARRRDNVGYLERKLGGLPGLKMPLVGPGCDHVYYVHALSYDEEVTGVSRDTFVRAVRAELPASEMREREGALIGAGYVQPIYGVPMFRQMIGYGTVQCPFRCPHYTGQVDYSDGVCPNAEEAHLKRVITHELMRPPMSHADLDDVADAFHKVAENLHRLSDRTAQSAADGKAVS